MTIRDVPSEIVSRAMAGDVDAFEVVLRECDDGLRGLAFRLLGDHHDMEDALQTAYLRAFRALPKFRPHGGSIAIWLHRIVFRTCMDELDRRKRARVDSIPADAVPRVTHEVETLVVVRDSLSRALAALSPEARAVLLLIDLLGFDYREAAEITEISRGTVASRLSRAREAVRSALQNGAAGHRA